MRKTKEAEQLARYKTRCKSLRKKMNNLYEVITPFVFHGKALGAMERDDIATVISQKESSYLCLGAFKLLMEEVDPVVFRLRR